MRMQLLSALFAAHLSPKPEDAAKNETFLSHMSNAFGPDDHASVCDEIKALVARHTLAVAETGDPAARDHLTIAKGLLMLLGSAAFIGDLARTDPERTDPPKSDA